MTDRNSRADEIRRTEALFRFRGGPSCARDEFDEDLYHEWTERDAARGVYGRSPFLRSLTPAELRLLVEADVQAQAEYAPTKRPRLKQASDRRAAWPSVYRL